MIPVNCRIAHEPENGKYGDCVRACVASLMELEPEKVPHFYHDNCDAIEGNRRIASFLDEHGFVPFWTIFDGSLSLEELLNNQLQANPTVFYMLYHSNLDGDHVVICRGGKVDFDPSWYPTKITGPNSSGYWGIMVIAKK